MKILLNFRRSIWISNKILASILLIACFLMYIIFVYIAFDFNIKKASLELMSVGKYSLNRYETLQSIKPFFAVNRRFLQSGIENYFVNFNSFSMPTFIFIYLILVTTITDGLGNA